MPIQQHCLLFIIAYWSLGVPINYAQDDLSWASSEKTKFTPHVHHPNIQGVTLFAQNPDIVTPIGIAVAPDGRVFVQENHTHKRNSDYMGPKTDRILVFEDTDNDGIADERSVFYEGHTFSTDLLFGPDGHLYVSTRWFIGRFPNASQKTKAEGEPEKLIICETDGNYPHNGVGGLAIDPANPEWLAFGFGENLGADYTFVGSDGVKLSGGAEGGSTYRCRTDGSQLTRQSTGHWNAFGMAYDLDGNLFSTDNDPNATPPNRLLHIVLGADFGYEYRYGRSGQHPLVCWNGENPGTLGMIGALGEAACGLIPHGPGKLLSASWTDNRIDLHSLTAKGESFTATREPFLSGPDDFRPVHFAYSADGRYLYFTDWVKLSYPVHGHGRIWRVKFKQPVSLEPSKNRPATNELSAKDAFAKLGSSDPYARTAAMHTLAEKPNALSEFKWQTETSGVARAHYAVALKRSNAEARTDIIPALLEDKDSEVRFVGIKWIADEKLSGYASNLKAVLDRSDLSRRDLLAVVAALARISGGSKREFSPGDTLLELALDTDKPPGLRAMALGNVKVDHPRLTVATLAPLTKSKHQNIRREAVHSLVIHADANRAATLAEIAADDSLNEEIRADAIAGLASVAVGQEELLNTLSSDTNRVISKEAKRTRVASGLAERLVETKPKPDQIEEWIELINREATEEPDARVGRRLFFHSGFAGCYRCHAINGRGSSVGPDLTNIHNQTDVTQEWLLKHIVNPNAEMAPYYRPQQLLTVDGKVLTGLIVGKEGKKQAYVAADGKVFFVDKEDVEERREMTTSIMPTGLLDAMSANEIRHLIAFLLSGEQRNSETVASNSRPIPGSVQRKERIHVIAEFEDDNFLEGKKTSHKASVTLVDDVPEGVGKFAVKTVVDRDAGMRNFVGTGFKIPVTDFSRFGEIRFWIKADFESGFNFQCSSGAGKTSVFPFTTVGSVGKWKLISAPVAKFSKPPWANNAADLKAIHFFQITAFGSGPYDGKTILLDHLVAGPLTRRTGTPASREMENGGEESLSDKRAAILRKRAARLREPRILKRGEPVDMFDGKTLDGWFTSPRVYVPRNEKFASMPSDRLYDEVIRFYEENEGGGRIPNNERVKNRGVWEVKDGAVIGGQVPGSIAGSYLISEKTYGDFELTLEANPDFPIDTGIMVRAHKLGSVGYQILVDNRPNGSIGGVYGNSVGSFLAWPFTIDGDEEPGNKIANIREGVVESNPLRGGKFKSDYSGTFDEFKKAWKPNDWNKIKVRCTGRLPLIETWINGVLVSRLDTATLGDVVPDYDAEAIFSRIGRKGHIAFEVHDSPTRQRWAPGAKCRWRNVRIRELEVDETPPKNISLSKINGRHWLLSPDGKPFFAHGITHVSNNRAKFDFAEMSDACRKLGFNAYGYGCPPQLRHDMPYIESWNHLVPISYYRGKNGVKFIDIFDPDVHAKLDAGIKYNCSLSRQNSHNVIGYCWTDLGSWPLDNPSGRNWVDFIRGLPEDAPGQQAYQEFLRTWEGDDNKARDQAFLRLIAREYFRVIGGAQRKYDPDHLVFGDRFGFNTIDPDVVKEMLPYVDAIAIQPHFWGEFPKRELDKVYKLTGKPIILCDFAIRFKDGDKDVRMWKMAEDSVAAGKAYTEYVKAAMETEYILGVFWCNPVDTPKGFNKPGVKQGFFGDGLSARPGLHEAVRKLNAYRDEITPRSVEQ